MDFLEKDCSNQIEMIQEKIIDLNLNF
jgi:hypothetical protein